METKGFTLIELLVTVAVVGILAGLSVSAYDEYRQKAYDVKAQVTVRNLITAASTAADMINEVSDSSAISSCSGYSFEGTTGPDERACTHIGHSLGPQIEEIILPFFSDSQMPLHVLISAGGSLTIVATHCSGTGREFSFMDPGQIGVTQGLYTTKCDE